MTYLSIFAIRKRSGKDARSWKVFWLDLMKMGIGQGFAWIINVVNSHRNSEMAAEEVRAQYSAQCLRRNLLRRNFRAILTAAPSPS